MRAPPCRSALAGAGMIGRLAHLFAALRAIRWIGSIAKPPPRIDVRSMSGAIRFVLRALCFRILPIARLGFCEAFGAMFLVALRIAFGLARAA